MKNPPSGGFFIAAKFPNQEVGCVKKPRSSNRRVSGNKKARLATGFFIYGVRCQAA
jgi:hypothetical protein